MQVAFNAALGVDRYAVHPMSKTAGRGHGHSVVPLQAPPLTLGSDVFQRRQSQPIPPQVNPWATPQVKSLIRFGIAATTRLNPQVRIERLGPNFDGKHFQPFIVN